MTDAEKKKQILFVDDEPNVLAGLRNLLRKERGQWDMSFVTSGREALAEMEKQRFDVVVSDMRMPGMDGAEFLRIVRDSFPKTVRIVLSGHAEREAIDRAIAVAHQFLSKPTDAVTVKAVIERTCEFQALMTNEGIQRVIGSIEHLPSLPDTYWDLTRAMERSDTNISDIATIVEKDVAMSLKILQLVNSAYFGLPRKTESISKAVAYLGLQNLKGLVAAVAVFGTGGNRAKVDGLSLDELQQEAVMTANLARKIAKEPKHRETAFTAGLLHHVGQLILASVPEIHYGDIIKTAKANSRPIHEVERERIGATHGTAGAYLIGVWGLPFSIAEAVAFHDCPSEVAIGNIDVVGAVYLASKIAEATLFGVDLRANKALDEVFLERAGLLRDVQRWIDEAASIVKGAPQSADRKKKAT